MSAPTACATTAASQTEVGRLEAEVRTLRAAQASLVERLERLENRDAVSRARSVAPASPAPAASAKPDAAASAASSEGGEALGMAPAELTVVRLKPKKEPAPRINTAVAVMEPDQDQMEMFISPAEGSSGTGSVGSGSAAPSRMEVPEKDPDILDAEYERAVAMLRTGNVEGGVETLLRFASENPRHPRADNALYFSGLGQMGLKDTPAAVKTFERLIKNYPAGDAVQDGMLRLAECRVRLNQAVDARALYTRVVTQFPGTAAATQAEQRLAALSP
nr:tetratricopeptide repeat protein [Corallococcus macrosporus]